MEVTHIYAEVLTNFGSWRIIKYKDNINWDVQEWLWFPEHNMDGKFDYVYMN